MKSMKPKTPAKIALKTPIRSRGNSAQDLVKDPVQVYCRVRPLPCESDLSCLKVIGHNTIVLTPPEMAINYKISNMKETRYIFKGIFDQVSRQQEVFSTVAQPLVENLVRGKNGLLFTYGVTGSGKTYTMTGDAGNRGIMPRCLDTLFKSISDYQAHKFVFKPDKMNGFDVQSEEDAMLERQTDMHNRLNKIRRKDTDPEIASRASAEASIVNGIDKDNLYSVFVTYIEVYNNSVYDLLEETPINKTLQSKIIREDGAHNMYVHGVTEVEVNSVEEAIEVFQIGQKRKRMGHTILNAESSRSHSIFTVRLVQAPVDARGEYAIQKKETISISQLSLVDLAGSERTNRTKNTGQRLREAGNINNSLMTLRSCLEILRENQMTGSSKKVPYRDSKITHYFKNYFDGEGQVRMVVCVNPRAEDYDETAQVMKFAEITQDVQIARGTPMKSDNGLTPGRRKANQLIKLAIHEMDMNGNEEARKLDVDIGLVYSLGPPFPNIQMGGPEADRIVQELIAHLELRINKRQQLQSDVNNRMDNFRMNLMQIDKDNIILRTENKTLKELVNQDRQKISALENKVVIYESSIDDLNRKNRHLEERLRDLDRQLNEKSSQLNLKEIEKEKQRRKFNSKLNVEKEKGVRELETKLKEQKSKMEERMKDKDARLRLVSEIISADKIQPSIRTRSNSAENLNLIPSTITQPTYSSNATPRTPRGVPVANIRHRRSRSTGDRWLEHRAVNPVPLGTILQPYYDKRKSVTKLTDAKDVTNQKTTKYCLINQEADTDGELETRLYKGDVIPTTGGGAQVIFNDVECLKQISPTRSPRKRPSQTTFNTPSDFISKCSMGIEGHSSKKPRV